MKLIRGCFQFQLCLPFALRRINLWRVGMEVGSQVDPVRSIGPYKLGWEEPGHVTRALLVFHCVSVTVSTRCVLKSLSLVCTPLANLVKVRRSNLAYWRLLISRATVCPLIAHSPVPDWLVTWPLFLLFFSFSRFAFLSSFLFSLFLSLLRTAGDSGPFPRKECCIQWNKRPLTFSLTPRERRVHIRRLASTVALRVVTCDML